MGRVAAGEHDAAGAGGGVVTDDTPAVMLHPDEAKDEGVVAAVQSAGWRVFVLPRLDGPAYPIAEWRWAAASVRAVTAPPTVPPAG